VQQADHSLRGNLTGVCLCVCDFETSKRGDLGPSWAVWPQKMNKICVHYFILPSFSVIHTVRNKEIQHRMSEW
jgi:hypothetical protein